MTKKRHHRTRNVNATQKETHNKDAASSEEDTDRLTKLPNDLLLNILERVDTLDAIRACILSRQMMKLRTMLSQFFLSLVPFQVTISTSVNLSEPTVLWLM